MHENEKMSIFSSWINYGKRFYLHYRNSRIYLCIQQLNKISGVGMFFYIEYERCNFKWNVIVSA